MHRLVYEQATGERLGPYDIVHHVDGNKLNNDPGNLERLTGRAAHLHRHNYHKNPAQRFDDDIPF